MYVVMPQSLVLILQLQINMHPRDTSFTCRIVILMVGLIETVLFSGVLFGWADLVYLMKLEGVFSAKCHQDHDRNGTYHCDQQDNLFDLAFTLAAFSKGSTFILVAFLLDNFGLRVSRIIANLQVTIGGFMIGYSAKANPYLLYPGTLLVGLGGSQVRMNSFVIANLFPNHKSTVLSLYNGAFCASAAMFLLFKYIHNLGIDVKTACILWSGLSGLMIVPTMLLLPSKTIEDYYEDLDEPSINRSSKESTSQIAPEDTNSNYRKIALETSFSESLKTKVYGTISYAEDQTQASQDTPVQQSFFSSMYAIHLYWSCVSGLLLAIYAGSFNRWVESIVQDKHTVSKMMELYGICQLPMLLVPPLGGLLLDYSLNQAKKESDLNLRRNKACCSRFWFLFITTLIQIVQLIFMFFNTVLMVQLSLVMYIFTRPMVNAVSVVHLRISFPSAHFNRLLGIVGTFSAIFSLVQFPLFVWSETNEFAANMTVLVMVILSLANPVISLLSNRTFV